MYTIENLIVMVKTCIRILMVSSLNISKYIKKKYIGRMSILNHIYTLIYSLKLEIYLLLFLNKQIFFYKKGKIGLNYKR